MEFQLNNLLKKNKISQTELAKYLNIAPSLVNRYALSRMEANYETLCKIADYLHITTDELLGRPTSLINLAVLNDTQRTIIERVQVASNKELEYMLLLLKMQGGNL